MGRALDEIRPVRVGLVLPEGTYRAAYESLVPRLELETLVQLAAVNASIPLQRLPRPTIRSRLGLPRSGSLESHLELALGDQTGSYWSMGRGLAALGGVAVARR
jgi:hypothetical protein